MSTLFRIAVLGCVSLIIGVGVNQFIHQGIRIPILLLALPRTENTVDLKSISVHEAYGLLLNNGPCFIDIRPKIEFEIDHIPGALSIPFNQHYGQANLLETGKKDEIVVVYGFEPSNQEAELLAEQLTEQGFNQTRILQDGFAGWIENGYPLETGKDTER
ncbi:rhodanese-like domain-containing protein [bacterium]|nr:rhodanese-like domain-containing protein [bacterium]RQV93745.1 MAG: rhodanese-like domain-containing protein [bacterium]